MFTFVSGGMRSGKSGYALHRASELGPPPWLYMAPEVEADTELREHLAKNRRDHEAIWRIRNAPARLEEMLAAEVTDGHGALVLDGFSIWLASRLAAVEPDRDRGLLAEVEQLADRLYRSPVPAVLVTTEVGLGFLPAATRERRLIDVVGMANQILAERAAGVVFMVSGVAQRLR
jgi:adenosylcobinamide kinase/adenosylcobinamide-phosphate guanylyltransferase